MKAGRKLAGIGILLFSVLIVISATAMLWEWFSNKQAAEAFQALREQMVGLEYPAVEGVEGDGADDVSAPEITPQDLYGKLKEQNSDMVGWIKIEGTKIDYPVMQTPNDRDFYLRRGFDRQHSYYGVPYVDDLCELGESNIIVYGHNTEDGKMFSNLLEYRNEDYFTGRSLIRFDTFSGFGTYQMVYVLKAIATVGNPDTFDFAQVVDFEGEEAFQEFVALCDHLKLYSTGRTLTKNDQLLVLSTCSYSKKNGRMIIVAKKVS